MKDGVIENWKDITGYEGLYQISDLGKVKSLSRTIISKSGISYPVKGMITYGSGSRYKKVTLVDKVGVYKCHNVHRLVGIHFVKKGKNKNILNHLSGIKSDNRAVNLEWTTYKGNFTHAVKFGLSEIHNKNHPKKSFPISQFNKEGVLIQNFPSINEAIRQTGFTGIPIGIKQNRLSHGFYWEFQKIKK